MSFSVLKPYYFFITILLVLTALAHGINMFNYPYYEADEGTYMSQAWSFATSGQLAPYTYIYDHAPAGWILISIWSTITGGFPVFGFTINSGRVLMLVLHLFSTLLLFLITKRLTGKTLVATLAVLWFSFSPLAIYFQRRVLLDNIMVFWLLLSLYLLLVSVNRINLLIVSGLSFGLAIVSKETAPFFLPVFIYLIYKLHPTKIYSIVVWSLLMLSPVLIYIAYALGRGEFFPSPDRVSMLGTWTSQLSRTQPGDLVMALRSWFSTDPVFMYLSIFSILINCYFAIKNFPNRLSLLLALSYILFLVRGGIVLEFYILPLIPFLALNISLAIWSINTLLTSQSAPVNILGFTKLISFTAFLLLAIFDLLYFGNRSKKQFSLFTSNQTQPQIDAVNWILSQNNPQEHYIIDNYAYLDLHLRNRQNFATADYYWKADMDPTVANNIFVNNWRNVSFVALTPQMLTDLNNPSNKLLITGSALKNSTLIQKFYQDGWGVDIYQVTR